MTDFVDRSCEQSTSRPIAPAGDGAAWVGAEIEPARCIVRLDDAAMDELQKLAKHIAGTPAPVALRERMDFELPALERAMHAANRLLDDVPGVVVVDRLPLDAIDRDCAPAIFWVIGQFVGRQVAQKWDGSMLYHVRDTGQRYSYGVRGSYTNVELVFHTDNAFAIAPPERVGLMCFNPAREGGVSRFCSLHTVHDRLLAHDPSALERLYRSMFWDRQAEHAPNAPPVLFAPMFRRDGERLVARMNVSLVRKGYEVAGETMDAELAHALDALERITDEPALCFELPIERGQIQFLNNVSTAHYRSEFVDFDEPSRKRHLLRSWHRDWGQVRYDG